MEEDTILFMKFPNHLVVFKHPPFKSLFCIVMQLNFKHFAPVGSKQVDTSVAQAPHKTLEI